jgi:hypothetical protein
VDTRPVPPRLERRVSNYLVSLIRTITPALVGAVLSWLALYGLDLPGGDREAVTAAVTGILVVVYYAVVRALETRWPKLGVLLGVPSAPKYGTGGAAKHGEAGGSDGGPTHRPAPDVGNTVHYVPTGTGSACHAALVTAVPAAEVKVSLFVAAPTGTSFVATSTYDQTGRTPGSWHWPQ